MPFGQLALLAAAVFAGAALYISLVEHPARLGLDDRSLLAEWKPAYKRGTAMQAPLAIIGFLLGLAAWSRTGHPGWALGALLMVAITTWADRAAPEPLPRRKPAGGRGPWRRRTGARSWTAG